MEQKQAIALTAAMGLVLGLASAHLAAVTYYGGEPSRSADALYSTTFALLVACGVNADRRGRAAGGCYEYGAFVFFLWPYVLPVYLYKTRRWWGLAKAMGIIGLFFVPWCCAMLVYWWLVASGT